MDIEFIGKRAYKKDHTDAVNKKASPSKKLKIHSKNNVKEKSDVLEEAIKDMHNIYRLFSALDSLSSKDIDQYLDDTCKLKRFTGVMILSKIISP